MTEKARTTTNLADKEDTTKKRERRLIQTDHKERHSLHNGVVPNEAKRKKFALVCKGKGFYTCKLCKGNSTIEWSPLYDPVFKNPCVYKPYL